MPFKKESKPTMPENTHIERFKLDQSMFAKSI